MFGITIPFYFSDVGTGGITIGFEVVKFSISEEEKISFSISDIEEISFSVSEEEVINFSIG